MKRPEMRPRVAHWEDKRKMDLMHKVGGVGHRRSSTRVPRAERGPEQRLHIGLRNKATARVAQPVRSHSREGRKMRESPIRGKKKNTYFRSRVGTG